MEKGHFCTVKQRIKEMRLKNLATLLIAGLAIVFTPSCKDVEGCTNPSCLNFDDQAETDDGSCDCGEGNQDERNLKGNTGNRTLLGDGTPYTLDGMVFVNDGEVLTINAGAVIKGKPGAGAEASALIVARGGKIMAEGTEANPIIFTAEGDDLNGSFDENITGEWGGVIILGSAGLNTNGEQAIEGIPTSEARGLFGGTNDADNSGVFRYVSIRHGGTNIGAGNEINGLTLGGVGSGTTIEHIEVFANADDGIEFFGGTVNVKYAITAYCGDDSYDYDMGWRGKGQFWVTVAGGDRGGEHDGGTDPEDGMPYAKPTIYNATYVGNGISEGKRALTFRDNAGGFYNNSIFVDFGKGIDVENLEASKGADSYERFLASELSLSGNIFWNVKVAGDSATATDVFAVSAPDGYDSAQDSIDKVTALVGSFGLNANLVVNPEVSGGASIDLIPNSAVVNNGVPASDSWFNQVTFKGAIDPNGVNWADNWTRISAKF
ncbi:MAG: hypothetical protein ACI9YL_000999 [Luteibaculaceae bacterium]|jgi:hypothetical protein